MNDLDKIISAMSDYATSYDDEYIGFPNIKDIDELRTYYTLQRKAYEYARNFFALMDVGGIGVRKELLPIVFRDEMAGIAKAIDDDTGYSRGCFICGNGYTSAPKQAVIFIDLPRRKRPVLSKKLKEYIRHEVIHYYLWLSDLPFEDDTAMFWAYCNIYDGVAYKEMDDEEQEKYDEYICKSKQYPDAGCTALKLLAEGIILNDDSKIEQFKSRLALLK